MTDLYAGAQQFSEGIAPQMRPQFERLEGGQHPPTLFIACSDSRVSPNLMTQSEPGDLFVVRNAGNIVPSDKAAASGALASIEYAVSALQVQHAVVCGHSGCGAMTAALAQDKVASMRHMPGWLEAAGPIVELLDKQEPRADRLEQLVELNTLYQLYRLSRLPCVQERRGRDAIQLHAWVFDIGRASLRLFHSHTGTFESFDSELHPVAATTLGRFFDS